MPSAHATAVNSFNLNHESYDQYRPSFADAAVDEFLVDLGLYDKNTATYDTSKKILEIAVGTGKFTKTLVQRGWADTLVGVEPSTGMLETFHTQLPHIKAVEGSSYHLPIEDSSVDAVIVAQGFHWFSDIESVREIHRVLKPNGTFGCIWNYDCPSVAAQGLLSITDDKIKYIFANGPQREKFESLVQVVPNSLTKPFDISTKFFEQSPWAIDVGSYVYSYDVEVPQYRRGEWRKLLASAEALQYFSPIASEVFYLDLTEIEWQDVYKLWETRSYITKLSGEKKAEIKAHIEALLQKTSADDKQERNGRVYLKKALGTHTIVTKAAK